MPRPDPFPFDAAIEMEGDGYVALCPELDIGSQGDSVEEARANLREALELFFQTASPEEIGRRFSAIDMRPDERKKDQGRGFAQD